MPTHLLDLAFLYKVAQMHMCSSQTVTLRGKQTHGKSLLKQDEKEGMDTEEEKCCSLFKHLEIRTGMRPVPTL